MESLSIDLALLQNSEARAATALNSTTGARTEAAARAAAEEFEAVLIAQMLAPMFSTVPTDGPAGGGHAETIFRSMQVEEYGKILAQRGGIGLAESVYREILRSQEV